jgi:hypothetical protein
MQSLSLDLQQNKNSLNEFFDLTKRILKYLPDVLTEFKDKNHYRIFSSQSAGTLKYIRPINVKLFIFKPSDFVIDFEKLIQVLRSLKRTKNLLNHEDERIINSVLYTMQQSIGAGLDLLVNPNSARKHVGNRFEELIGAVFMEIGIANSKTTLQIPYETDETTKIYKCENDLVLSPFNKVRSTSSDLDENEIVVSIKTTSKDRMGKIFIDKLLLEKFVGHPQKVIGVFLNDVQRKESDNISYTLVSGLFMVYSKFLTKLDGVYYLDVPPKALKSPYNKLIKPFSDLLAKDIWELFPA